MESSAWKKRMLSLAEMRSDVRVDPSTSCVYFGPFATEFGLLRVFDQTLAQQCCCHQTAAPMGSFAEEWRR